MRDFVGFLMVLQFVLPLFGFCWCLCGGGQGRRR